MSKTSGPRVNFETVSSSYPKPKKGDKLTCLACNKGKVLGPKGIVKKCTACKGKGTITVK